MGTDGKKGDIQESSQMIGREIQGIFLLFFLVRTEYAVKSGELKRGGYLS